MGPTAGNVGNPPCGVMKIHSLAPRRAARTVVVIIWWCLRGQKTIALHATMQLMILESLCDTLRLGV